VSRLRRLIPVRLEETVLVRRISPPFEAGPPTGLLLSRVPPEEDQDSEHITGEVFALGEIPQFRVDKPRVNHDAFLTALARIE
jgi:hypothetical protein